MIATANSALRFEQRSVRRSPTPAVTGTQSNLNAFVENWVRSIKSECLSKLILFGETLLRHAITEFLEHYRHERNH
jgi:putative transposase